MTIDNGTADSNRARREAGRAMKIMMFDIRSYPIVLDLLCSNP